MSETKADTVAAALGSLPSSGDAGSSLTTPDLSLRELSGAPTPLGREEAGRYELRRELARGGQGVVYVAWDTHLGREVAFKQLLRSAGRDPEGSLSQREARFVREARITAQLDHPGIAPLYEVGRRPDGSLYATQRLVPGRTLAAALEACTSLEQRLALLGPFLFMCETVAFAHRRGVIHRDLKPDNVLVQENGQAVVLDWGLGRTGEEVGAAEAPPASPGELAAERGRQGGRSPGSTEAPVASLMELAAERTQAGAVLGTPAYMSPEQAAGDTLAVGPPSDVWALGVMLYQVLSGRRPFEGSSTSTVLGAVKAQLLTPVRAVCADAPPALAQLAEQALSREPAARPPDAGAFARRLVAATQGRLEAPRPRRRWRAALAGALLLASALVALAWRSRASAPPAGTGEVAPAVLKWSDLPMSPTTSEVARAKFHEGLELFAAGQRGAATGALTRAFEADPRNASAALQRAWVATEWAQPVGQAAREAYREALTRRADLGPRDQAFLDAIGPDFLDPPDWNQAEQRLVDYLEHRPGDVQAVESLAMVQTKLDNGLAAATFEREARLSPGDVGGHWVWAQVADHLDGSDRKRAILAECIARRPTTTDCRIEAFNLALIQCDGHELERLGREFTALAPGRRRGWYERALAAAVQGAPDQTVAELQARGRALAPPEERAGLEREDAHQLAWRRGDLATVLRLLSETEKAPPAEGWGFDSLVGIYGPRVSALKELGRTHEAARAAMAFLSRAPALPVPERPGFTQAVPMLLAAAASGGLMDIATLRARREAWLASHTGGAKWPVLKEPEKVAAVASAFFSEDEMTPAQAQEALGLMARLGLKEPQPHQATRTGDGPTEEMPVSDAYGALLLGAGRAAEAIPWLAAASRSCDFEPPIRTTLLLARAHEESHDVPQACAAYARVLAAWPNPRPRSVSVEVARSRSKRLGCQARRQ